MTKITFFKKDGLYTGFVAEGHAEYADKGSDIICAAISVLTTNTINALSEITKEEVEYALDEDKGLIVFNLQTNKSPSSQVLMQALVMGLEGIQNEYGSKYCFVDYKEENANVKA